MRSRVVLRSLGVVLGLFGGVIRGRVILRGFGVVARGNINCGVILYSLGGVVLGRLGVVFSRFVGVISCSLSVVAGS